MSLHGTEGQGYQEIIEEMQRRIEQLEDAVHGEESQFEPYVPTGEKDDFFYYRPAKSDFPKRRKPEAAGKDKRLWDLTQVIVDRIAELNRDYGWVCDWSDGNQEKYYFGFDRDFVDVQVRQATYHQKQPTKNYMCKNTLSDIHETFSDKELKAFVTQEWVED